MKFKCSYCQQKLEADEELYGETVGCPSCNKEITVPYFTPSSLVLNAKCPSCGCEFNVDESEEQSETEVLLEFLGANVDYEAPERDELPVWNEIQDIDNLSFTNHEVCFTGFDADEKQELKELAVNLGMTPRSGITQNLTMLICGRNAGPVKMAKAKERGLTILTIQEFKTKLENSQISS